MTFFFFFFFTFVMIVRRHYKKKIITKISLKRQNLYILVSTINLTVNLILHKLLQRHVPRAPARTHTHSHTLTHFPRCQKYPLVRQIWGQSIIYSSLNDIFSLPVPGYLRKQPSLFLMNLYICNLLSKIHAGMNGLWGWHLQRRV